MPSASAMAPAMASITSAKEVLAIDWSYLSCIVRTDASGKLAFTDLTAWRTWFSRSSVPAWRLRTAKVTVRATVVVPAR